MKRNIWIIDDEQGICSSLKFALQKNYRIETFNEAESAIEKIKSGNVCDLILIDLKLGNGTDGITAMKTIKKTDPSIVVIIMTAFASIETTVQAMKSGAYTYLSKPLNLDELYVVLSKALEYKALEDEVRYLSEQLGSDNTRDLIIGNSPEMKKVFQLIDMIKNVDANVLIAGESGTGKELVAKQIHSSGKRAKQHFVVVNCAAIPENLLEAEFFGSKKGSYTGSTQDVKGKFEIADKGTLFLDEIGDMPLNLQGKLLRAIQDKEFTPIGATEALTSDARVIAATNRNLTKLIAEKKFREDLYYRLNVVSIVVPTLRERREDIPLLCNFFREKYSREMNKRVTSIDSSAMEVLKNYDYPGNVRQLANIMEYACIVNKYGNISVENFPDYLSLKTQIGKSKKTDTIITEYLSANTICDTEKRAIEATLRKYNYNRSRTAESLGISIRSLYNKIKEHGINLK